MADLVGRLALVTGASSGIGRELARQLADRGADLVVTARREAELDALAAELRARGRTVTVVALDLARPGAAEELARRTEGMEIDILVNNAGFGTHRRFLDIAWDDVARQLALNMVALTELCHRLGRGMVARRRGWILNVASVGAYTPCPTYATYAASKAYVRNFTEALAAELAPDGVRVLSLCPGLTASEFHQVAGQRVPPLLRPTMMSAERCARIGLDALFGWRRNVVTGWVNKLSMWLLRFVPRRAMVWIGAFTMGRPASP
jgi:short-subunit dehydrogenase